MTTVYRVPIEIMGFNNTATRHVCLVSGNSVQNTTEARAERQNPVAVVYSNIRAYVSANVASKAAVLTVRRNAAGSASTVTVGAGLTGWFEDTTNQVQFSADDEHCLEIARTDAGTITFKRIIVDALVESPNSALLSGDNGGVSLTTASVTRYITANGALGIQTTEIEQLKGYVTRAATAQMMRVNVYANARSTTNTFNFRVNGANGNQTIPIGAGLTGWFEDASNTDTIAAGDYITYSIVTGTGSGSFNFDFPQVSLEDASTSANLVGFANGNMATNATRYASFIAASTLETTEALAETKLRGTGTIKNAGVHILTNASTADVTYTLRINGADTSITFTVTGGAGAGLHYDSTNTETYADGDLVCWKIVRPTSTGTFTAQRNIAEIVPDSETYSPPSSGNPYYAYAQM